MKVLFLNVVFRWGSTGRIISDICEKLEECGHTGIAIYGRGQSWPGHYRVASRLSVFWHVLLTRITDLHGRFSSASTRRIIKIIQKEQPDIIHLHNIHGYWLNYPLLFKYLNTTDIPLVWTLHDCWAFTGHCCYFDSVNCKRYLQSCGNCPQLEAYPRSLLFDNSSKNLIHKKQLFGTNKNLTIVSPSQWLADLAKQTYLNRHPILVIHNGIDTEVFRPRDIFPETEQLQTGQKIVLGVASPWSKRKGLEVFSALAEKNNSAYKIVLLGLAPKQIKKLHPAIIGLPRTNTTEELASWYSRADVFANPTYEDNFPTTNLEALACGTPVITFKTGGSPEAIDDTTGSVVPCGDVETFHKAIITLLQHPKSYWQTACRERAIQRYSKTDRYMDYINLYQQIIQQRERK